MPTPCIIIDLPLPSHYSTNGAHVGGAEAGADITDRRRVARLLPDAP
jgi:hypothetical protein